MIIEDFTINFNIFDKYSDIQKGITYYLSDIVTRRNILTYYKHKRKPIPKIINSKFPSIELSNMINSANQNDILKLVPLKYRTSNQFKIEADKLRKKKLNINLAMANIIGQSLCHLPGNIKCIPVLNNAFFFGTDIKTSYSAPAPVIVGVSLGEDKYVAKEPSINTTTKISTFENTKSEGKSRESNCFPCNNIFLIFILLLIIIYIIYYR